MAFSRIDLSRRNKALLAGTALGLLLATGSTVLAQQATPAAKPAKTTFLDKLTISADMQDKAAIEAMAAVSHLSKEELDRIQANTPADLFKATPGVAASMNGDDPATAINIRGMQQEGRVVVTLDGARQDYSRPGHGSGSFYIEPELLKSVTIIRGPVSNAYGSGGIGGVAAFETKDARDMLRDGETWALSEKLGYESNGQGVTTSTTGALALGENADVIGNLTYRNRSNYFDGTGKLVPWTGEEVLSGFAKGTFRPAEGHEIKIGTVIQKYDDVVSASAGSSSASLSRYDALTYNETYTASYTYKPEDNELVDFLVNFYHNHTRADQTRLSPAANVGEFRYYDVSTTGFNTRNASRFTTGDIEHTITVGGDYYYLVGDSDVRSAAGAPLTVTFGEGKQHGYGVLAQWDGNYQDFLEATVAMRYDGYQLNGQTKAPVTDVTRGGSRFSPRVTLGVTPVEGFQIYGTYAEGYRAPTLQNMFRGAGSHGDGTYALALGLMPEVARSWEAGVNLKYNDLIFDGDTFRAKVNVFHTTVDDYIEADLVSAGATQVKNIGTARLQGVEAEALYDFGAGFVNVSGSLGEAKLISGLYAGQGLNNTPLQRYSATVGARFLEEQLTVGAQYQYVGDVTRTSRSNPAAAPQSSPGYSLVNLFADYQVTEDVKLNLGIDNVLDTAYTDPQSAWATSNPSSFQGKGRTFKIGITGRIGG